MSDLNEEKVGPEFAAQIGLDWADQKHFWAMRTADGKLQRGELLNTPEAIQVWAAELGQRFGGRPIAVALEQSRGAVIAMLCKYAHLVLFPVHPNTVSNYRKAFYPSGAKSDPGDGHLILELLLTHPEKFRRLQPDTVETRKLQFLAEERRKLVNRHTSEVQRLIGWLKQVFPQIVHWFDDPASVMVGSLLLRWPTLQALQKASPKVLLKFFNQHNCRGEELIRQRIEQIRQAVIATTDEALMQTGLLCIQNSIALLEIMRAGTVFFRPLPYADPARLVWVAIQFPAFKAEFVPSPDYVTWRRGNHTFEELAAMQLNCCSAMILNGADPIEVFTASVSSNFLSCLGATPMLGSTFSKEAELPDGPPTVLLTNRFWQTHFASRRDVPGHTITLNGHPYSIAGVLPESFVFPVDAKVDMLTTLSVSPAASHRDRTMSSWAVLGRLKQGITLAQARSDVAVLLAASKADLPRAFPTDASLVVEPLQQHRMGSARLLLLVLSGAASCLLLITCTSVAGLLLGRWAGRSREIAIRAALGASRGRLVRQLLAEATVLGVSGCVMGLVLTNVTLRGFGHYAGRQLPRLSEIGMDGRVFGIALIVSAITIVIFAVVPALRVARTEVQSVLQRAGGFGLAGGHPAFRRALVGSEVAFSFVLLSAALLLIETLWQLQYGHLGFQPEHLIAITIPLQRPAISNDNRNVAVDRILSRIRSVPGTVAAAVGECTPVSLGPIVGAFSRSDRPLPEPLHRGVRVAQCGIGPDYFRSTGGLVKRGRPFIDADFDRPGTAAIINEAAASAYFPGEDPLGKQILGDSQGQWKTVIGVVADSRNQGLNMPAMPQVFLDQIALYSGSNFQFLVRTVGEEAHVTAAIRAQLQNDYPGTFAKFEMLDDRIQEMTTGPRFDSMLVTGFATISFLLTMIGVYSVLANSVQQRTREIGIRIALGASPWGVLQPIVREGVLLIGTGCAIGFLGARLLLPLLKDLLYDISPTSPRTYAAAALGLVISGTLAMYAPARRAIAIEPLVALRHE